MGTCWHIVRLTVQNGVHQGAPLFFWHLCAEECQREQPSSQVPEECPDGCRGDHLVECYAVSRGVVIARDMIRVPIRVRDAEDEDYAA